MVDELEEARERVKAAWSLIEADAIRLKEAVRADLEQVKNLGPRTLWESYPLHVLGALGGAAFLVGLRGGHRKAAYRAIARAGTDVVTQATQQLAAAAPKGEKSLRRKLIETLVLALGSKGAQMLAELAQSRVQPPQPPQAPSEPAPKELLVPSNL